MFITNLFRKFREQSRKERLNINPGAFGKCHYLKRRCNHKNKKILYKTKGGSTRKFEICKRCFKILKEIKTKKGIDLK